MTELSFLLSLLLDHKLAKPVQTLIKERIKEIEARPNGILSPSRAVIEYPCYPTKSLPAHMVGQAPSTIANFIKEGMLEPVLNASSQSEADTPIAPIVTSSAVAQALVDRQNAIRNAAKATPLNGKPENGRTSPRKF